MTRESGRSPEQLHIVLVDDETMHKAERLIEGCEACSDIAQVPFDAVLDFAKGSDSMVTDYLMERPARCPKCFRQIREKTLVVARAIPPETPLT